MLNEQELERYKRQIALSEWGVEGQLKLKSKKVFVAGAGGSGSPIITQLALLGVGHIVICDFDSVELSNSNRQFIHFVGDTPRVGMNKAESAKKTIQSINPNVKVTIYTEKLTEDNIDDMVGDADMLFDCVDKFATKFILSDCCIRKKIPHMFCGMMDINIFACIFYPPKTPCFQCLFDREKAEMLALMQQRFSQENIDKDEMAMTIPVSAPALFMCTGFLVNEALKILLGIGEPLYNKYVLILQKNNEKINQSVSYEGMHFWNTEYFDEICSEQGFDWETMFRGNVFEALDVVRNPECEHCSSMV